MEEQAVRRISHIVSAFSVDNEHKNNNNNDNAFLSIEGTAGKKNDDDIVICCAIRTAVTKAKRGAFKDTHPTELLAAVLKGVIDRTKIDPKLIGDISVGTVLHPGGGATQVRMAQLLAGIPYTVPIATVNRQCSSGLQAIVNIASMIQNGTIDIGIGAGLESMSQHDMMSSVGDLNPRVQDHDVAKDCLLPMGITSENVAEQYNISRDKQDQFAVLSYEKAMKAQAQGHFDSEIVPVKTKVQTPEGEKDVVVTKDEGPRKTTLADLKKLKPAFKENGTTTAGNASQVSDGAAAVLLMKRKTAVKLQLAILGKFVSAAVVGVPPSVMGIGPAFAIPEAIKRANVKLEDIDVFEINEAFASQAVYSVEKLGIPLSKVNPNGGAIALGHPLGCTGARQVATLFAELKRTGARMGCTSMCIGTGMGMAAVFERE